MSALPLLPSASFSLDGAVSTTLNLDEEAYVASESHRQTFKKRCFTDLTEFVASSDSETSQHSGTVESPSASPFRQYNSVLYSQPDLESWLNLPESTASSTVSSLSLTNDVDSHLRPAKRFKPNYGDAELELVSAARHGDILTIHNLARDNFSFNVDAKICGNTAFMYATFYGHMQCLELLLELGASIEARSLSGKTPLHWAVQADNVPVATFLLETGANVNAADHQLQTPLHLACRFGSLRMVELLVRFQAKLNVFTDSDTERNAPIHEAVLNPANTSIVEYLLRQGCHVDLTNGLNRTALHRAAYRGYTSLVQLMLSYGANVNAIDVNGRSPLHWAVYWNQIECCKVLLSYGADISIRDKLRKTCLQFARFKKLTTLVALLLAHTPQTRSCPVLHQ